MRRRLYSGPLPDALKIVAKLTDDSPPTRG
jgi:hypothetical protein